MKRKVIRQGHNTLTITLPSKWVKEFNLVSGQEIDLTEKDNGLFLSTQKNEGIRRTEFSLEGMDIPTIWKYFMSAYREGYDEIVVRFKPNTIMDSPYRFFTAYSDDVSYAKERRKKPIIEALHKFIYRFIGMEIVEQGEGYVLIKEMGEATSKEFDNSLRRIFLLLQEMAERISESIEKENPKLVANMHETDINLDKFHDYCIRVLNKTGYKDSRASNLLFAMLFMLELLGDEFKAIAKHLYHDFPKEKFPNLKPVTSNVKKQVDLFYNLYYKFDKEKILEISKLDAETHSELFHSKTNKATSAEKSIFNHLRRISRYMNSLTELRIEMEF